MKRIKNILYTTYVTIFAYLLMWTPVGATKISEGLKKGMADLWDKYWFYIAVFVAFGVLTGLLAFIVLFIRLGANATNPQERSRIIREMMAVAGTTAALGSITFIIAMYLSLFR